MPALASGWAAPPLLFGVGLLLPQAVMTRAITVPAATAATAVLFLICRHTPSCGCAPATRVAGLLTRPWIQRIAEAVTEEVEREHGDEDGQAGEEHEVRVDLVNA